VVWGSDPVRGFFSGSMFEPREEEPDPQKEAHRAMRFNVSGDCSRRSTETRPNGEPMVSWYSLLAAHTGLKNVVGSAVAFGRFDYRTMEPDQGPKTFKVVDKQQLMEERWIEEGFWFDFVADVGDGFNSTYAIAHALAQPLLYAGHRHLGRRARAKRLAKAIQDRTWAVLARAKPILRRKEDKLPEGGSPSRGRKPQPQRLDSSRSESSSPRTPTLSIPEFLPRGSFMLVGGDLAYPNPSLHDYFKRFYKVYNDALPFDSQIRLPSKKPQPVFNDGDRTAVDVDPHKRPVMFVMPGNHDWFDGLETYRSTVLTFDHLGGWRVPQVTTYFVLQLPFDWWLFCLDAGMGTDIDQLQMQYFLHYISTLPNSASVVLVCHDPNWINDALNMPSGDPHTQSRVSTLADALGDRLRMRLCGDIHNYTRYEYDDAPTAVHKPLYVVSGGGGAFLHGTTQPGQKLKIYGEQFDRVACYPPPKKRYAWRWLLRFRLVNWKFDVVGSLLYCILVAPLLPVTNFDLAVHTMGSDPHHALSMAGVSQFWSKVGVDFAHLFRGYLSHKSPLTMTFAVLLCLTTYAQTDKVLAPWKRVVIGTIHGLVHLAVALFILVLFSNTFDGAVALGMTDSTRHSWRPATLEFLKAPLAVAVEMCGATCAAVVDYVADSQVGYCFASALGSMDVMEGLAYYHSAISTDANATAAAAMAGCPPPAVLPPAHGFNLWALYYFHVMWFYWLLAAPAVGFVLGVYLCLCVTVLGCSMEHAFAAFMIEDWKHFLRIRIDPVSRNLRVYVVGIETVAKQWQRCPQHDDERRSHPERKSHEMHHPSLWAPASRHTKPRIIDTFDVTPRDASTKPTSPEAAGLSESLGLVEAAALAEH
jgi:hypothetical protein